MEKSMSEAVTVANDPARKTIEELFCDYSDVHEPININWGKPVGNEIDSKQSLAMQYFEKRRLGLGMASKMAGMQKNEFIALLSQHNIDIYRYSDEELLHEFNLVDKITDGFSPVE